MNFLFLNPLGLLIIFTPLILYVVKEQLKRYINQKRE
jgi:hypothetical protein